MVKIENLSVAFGGSEVVKNVSFTIKDGEILGVVGESGSGKSVTALTLMGLVSRNAEITSGRILFDSVTLREAGKPLDEALYRSYQGNEISMIFQEPMTSLNPTKRAGVQVEEMLLLHTALEKEERKKRVLESFASVGLSNPEKVYESYPHELSGGMRQRVMIAMAILLHPDLVIADEPTTALDVTIQRQIVSLLKEINTKERNGCVVEQGETEQIFRAPEQEYTKRLMEAVPSRMKPRVSVFEREAGKREGESPRQVLTVKDLSVFYQEGGNSPFSKKKHRCVVEGANFCVYEGESLGLVGESGCGKTSLSKAVLGIHRDITGEIHHETKRPQMVFQDPYSSLNPSKTIGWLLQEPLRVERVPKADREAAAYDMLHRVGLEDSYFHRKPSQLSGGQRQRISIAQALIAHPGFVVADEPVSALDVTIQAQIMELLQKLQQEMKLSYLFISHDINVVYHMCDRIMVMKAGHIIETGKTEEIFRSPKEPYTRLLLGEQ